jgi:Zn-finger protein
MVAVKGVLVRDCSKCLRPHLDDGWEYVINLLKDNAE